MASLQYPFEKENVKVEESEAEIEHFFYVEIVVFEAAPGQSGGFLHPRACRELCLAVKKPLHKSSKNSSKSTGIMGSSKGHFVKGELAEFLVSIASVFSGGANHEIASSSECVVVVQGLVDFASMKKICENGSKS